MGRAFEYRKARKLKRWGNMAKTFTKLGKEIAMAVKTGGPDPQANSRLRILIQNAKAANMPKENVERAIKRAVSKDQEDYKEMVYEGYGPYGVAIIIDAATDNTTRTVANVRSYFNKLGGALSTSGSVDYLFDHKCIFKIKLKDGLDIEELELEMIDLGADEIFEEEGELQIYGEFSAFGPIQKYLEEKELEIISAEFDRIPMDYKVLNEEQQAQIEKLLSKFEDDEDVSAVYHNMKLND